MNDLSWYFHDSEERKIKFGSARKNYRIELSELVLVYTKKPSL